MTIIVVLYSIWAVYAGYQVLSGKSAWLDDDAPLNKIVKIILSFLLGYVIGAFYFIYLIVRIVWHL